MVVNSFDIIIGGGQFTQTFEVKAYTDQSANNCKYEVYALDSIILILKQNDESFKIVSNSGNAGKNTISQIIERIAAKKL